MTAVGGWFRFEKRGARARTELVGGVTTFLTMAYILVVNPAILAHAGIPPGPGTVATILSAAFGCFAMAAIANLPIAVAPYMGENAFLAFGLAGLGIGWQQRLGTVFLAGLLFLALSAAGIRGWLARSIPPSLKHAFAAGIGFFLAFIGLYETGIVTSGAAGLPLPALAGPAGMLRAPDVPVRLGNWRDPAVALALSGFLIISLLLARRVRGALLAGIAATAAAGFLLGVTPPPARLLTIPAGPEWDLSRVALHLDVAGVLRLSLAPVVLTLLLMSFFDTLGTLVATGAAAGMLDRDGNFPNIERPMIVDALSCIASSLLGTSTSGAYIESAAGIRDGARTGLASVVTGACFLLSLFFLPLFSALQAARYAYGPALVAVGAMMVGSLRHAELSDWTEAAPAFVTIALMVFTYNIANGMAAGLLLGPVLKLAAGRRREIHPGAAALAAVCALYFFFGLPH